jgi:hypothetical protein
MGNLLSSAIKMQDSVVATATLKYDFATNGVVGGTCIVYKNGIPLQTMTTDTSVVTTTINAGDTFYVTIQNPNTTGQTGCSIDYVVNGSYVTGYFTGGTGVLSSATFTASAGNEYRFYNNLGAV